MPENLRDEIILGPENVLNATLADSITYNTLEAYDTDFGEESGSSGPWDVEAYAAAVRVHIVSEVNRGYELCFDLVNIDAPFANAIRRVLLSHVPTMAIEKMYLYQNTSLVQDEVLAHRLGLIPLKADPRLFDWPSPPPEKKRGAPAEEPPAPNAKETLVFELNVACTKRAGLAAATTAPSRLYAHSTVYSRDLTWVPLEGQARLDPPPRPVHGNIIIAKLRPGQEMELRVHAVKGVGSDHAKFSPVATASYRLLPTIRIKTDPQTGKPFRIAGDDARRLKESFSQGVVALKNDGGEDVAEIVDARPDMCSRNVFRFPELAEKVHMGRKRRHFIYLVESTEAVDSADLVVEACKVLQTKCSRLLAALDKAPGGTA